MNRAAPGTSIIVTGHHSENVIISKDGIRLIGVGAVLTPPAKPAPNTCSDPTDGTPGICVVGDVSFADPNGPPKVNRQVHDVAISGFTVQGFSGSGIFVFGADRTVVWGNHLINDGGYGVFANTSTGTVIALNVASGAAEANIYVGDSPLAGAVVVGNESSDSFQGIFVRDAEHAVIEGNHLFANCVGVLVLADAPGPAGALSIHGNLINDNSKACAAGDDGTPPLSGVGVLLVGAHDVSVTENWIAHNVSSGTTAFSGGAVVITAPADPTAPAGTPAPTAPRNNTVRGNVLVRNSADIFSDGTGTGNVFQPNACTTSTPAGLCAP